MPEMPDVVSGEIIESEWGNDIRDRTIQRYASVTERSSLNATPDAGDLSFLEDTGIVSVYFAGSWRNIFYNDVQHSAVMALDVALTTGFGSVASETFNPPATWAAYSLSAMATVATQAAIGLIQARMNIAGSIGPTASHATTTTGVSHLATGLTGAANVVVQARKTEASPTIEVDTALLYIATRTT